MHGNDILPFVKEFLLVAGKRYTNAFHERHLALSHLGAVEVDFAGIIVGEDEDEFRGKVLSREGYRATDVDVGMFISPRGAYDVTAVGSEGSCPGVPRTVVVPQFLPAVGWCLPGVSSFPGFFIGHGGYGFQHGTLLTSHETVGCPIHPEQAFQRFLIVGPMAGVAFVQLIIRGPDGEIGIIDHDRHRRQPEVSRCVRFEHISVLCAEQGA